MQSQILIAQITTRDEYINKFINDNKINKFDIITLGKSDSKNTNSIGIDEIKNLKSTAYLKPQNSKYKAILIYDAELLTVEAQNALLKILEEPPESTYIILCANTTENFLPTILSRCKIINLNNDKIILSDNEKKEFENFINNLPDMGTGERLKKAETLAKDKDEAIAWITKLIIVLRAKMLESYSSEINLAIRKFQSLHTLLKNTNTNPRFAIENALLSLTPKV